MGKYRLAFKKPVSKDLRSIPNADVRRILERFDELASNPRPLGSEKLSGQERYRIRQGDYRIIYEIDEGVLVVVVVVVKVGHRREVYRD